MRLEAPGLVRGKRSAVTLQHAACAAIGSVHGAMCCIWRWRRKGKEKRPRIIYACNSCSCDFAVDQLRFHCSECADFDLCSSCHAKNEHPHHCFAETSCISIIHKRLRACRTVRGADGIIAQAFKCYANRPCLGEVVPGGDFAWEWITYSELHAKCLRFLEALRAKLGSHVSAVALSGPNTVAWFVADFALLLDGIAVFPVHADADPAVIKHIVENVDCCFVSAALLPKFQACVSKPVFAFGLLEKELRASGGDFDTQSI